MASADVATCPPPPPPETVEAGPVAPPPPPVARPKPNSWGFVIESAWSGVHLELFCVHCPHDSDGLSTFPCPDDDIDTRGQSCKNGIVRGTVGTERVLSLPSCVLIDSLP